MNDIRSSNPKVNVDPQGTYCSNDPRLKCLRGNGRLNQIEHIEDKERILGRSKVFEYDLGLPNWSKLEVMLMQNQVRDFPDRNGLDLDCLEVWKRLPSRDLVTAI